MRSKNAQRNRPFPSCREPYYFCKVGSETNKMKINDNEQKWPRDHDYPGFDGRPSLNSFALASKLRIIISHHPHQFTNSNSKMTFGVCHKRDPKSLFFSFFNRLSPNSENHSISPHDITTWSSIQLMRKEKKEMNSKDKRCWCFNKFS